MTTWLLEPKSKTHQMLVPFKKGLSFISVGLAALILDRIFGFLEPLMINSITKIWSVNPLLIVEIIAVSIMGFGGILILEEKYGWFKKSTKDNTKQYDVKKLSETVFKKLMRIQCRTDYKGNLIFEIPTDERALQPRSTNTYHMWLFDKNVNRDESNQYTSIQQAIPALKIGEKYLQSNYADIYKLWLNVKNILEKHNENRENFKKELGHYVIEKFKKECPTFKEIKELDENSRDDAYFIDKIQRFLFSSLRNRIEEPEVTVLSRLKIWKNYEFWYLKSNSIDILMASLDESKIDENKIRQIFRDIITDKKTIESFDKAIEIDPTFYDIIEQFSEKLEDEVVNEIDNLQSSSS